VKSRHALENPTVRPRARAGAILLAASVAALAVTFNGRADAHGPDRHVNPPPVPTNIQVPVGFKAFLEGHATGTQNYVCLPSGASFAWTFFAPQATLFNDRDRQIITHFLSPNPDEPGVSRATWQDSRDTSAVWAFATPDTTSNDAHFVAPGAIPWLRLQVVGDLEGPTGGDTLTVTKYIQRVNTRGGIIPPTGCSVATDVGKKVLVPYTADYIFYRAVGGDEYDGY
jgi:hypothetical protein